VEIVLGTLVVAALIAAVVLRRAGRAARADAGLPHNARVVYSDTGAWTRVERPLFSARHQLTGKPDYIIEDARGGTIPIEVKPNRTDHQPRASDALQLMAYGVLVEEEFGGVCSYGLLKYRNRVFQIDFTDSLRLEFFRLLQEMRVAQESDEVDRSHSELRRCRYCGYRDGCDQSLAD
jgi:CRISPR-associated exonuclease Cas4